MGHAACSALLGGGAHWPLRSAQHCAPRRTAAAETTTISTPVQCGVVLYAVDRSVSTDGDSNRLSRYIESGSRQAGSALHGVVRRSF